MKRLLLIFALLLNIACIAQEDKTVTITVSGTGKTIEDAKLNALRSAIEQTFGAFISSKTEILNDNLVKDEIVSVANGNVQKYEVVSQVEIPNIGYSITLYATVSIDKLTYFAESKGVTVEFKGNLFAANIKLQKLNEDAEQKVMFELFGIVHEKFQTSFDYLIETKEPILDDNQTNYLVPIKVEAICNKNYDLTVNYLIKVLNSISISDSQLNDYSKLKKKTYKIVISYKLKDYIFNFRNEISFKLIERISKSWNFYLGCFDVENGITVFHGPSGIRFPDQFHEWEKIFVPFTVLNYYQYSERGLSEFTNGKIDIDNLIFKQDNYQNDLHVIFPYAGNKAGSFEWYDIKSLTELEKIKNYTVKSSGIISKFNNGGYVIYEKNGNGIVAYPFKINLYNNWGKEENFSKSLGTSSKLFDGRFNTEKISLNSENNVGKVFKKLNYAGFNDWVIPSADELSLVFKNVYLLGLNNDIYSYYTFYSSTEYLDKYFQNSRYVFTYKIDGYYKLFMEKCKLDKDFNMKNDFQIYLSNSAPKVDITTFIDPDKFPKTENFQPIRYFKTIQP